MDSITHIVIGAAEGELLAGKKLGKTAMLWGALANSIPDMDVALSSFQNIPDGLLSHRGFTHSILFAVILSPLLGYLFHHWYKSKGLNLWRWIGIFAIGMFSHLFIDSLTSYGTGLFEPFSHYRVSFNTIFVVDPFYTFPLIISFAALLILKRNSTKRTGWAAAGLVVSCFYLLFTFYNKYNVDEVAKENLAKQNILFTDYFTTPTPFNNFLWNMTIKEKNQFQLGYYSILDKDRSIAFYSVPANTALLKYYSADEKVKKLIRFSQDYYSVSKGDSGELDFHDLRFGQIGGWYNPAADFVFTFHLKPNADNNMVIQRGRFMASTKEALSGLIKRITGKK